MHCYVTFTFILIFIVMCSFSFTFTIIINLIFNSIFMFNLIFIGVRQVGEAPSHGLVFASDRPAPPLPPAVREPAQGRCPRHLART